MQRTVHLACILLQFLRLRSRRLPNFPPRAGLPLVALVPNLKEPLSVDIPLACRVDLPEWLAAVLFQRRLQAEGR